MILTGFMGTGKSRIGRILADKLGMPYVDMDRLIEERQAMPITDIFKQYGEAFFRELEKQLCHELSQGSGQIISTGGGGLIPKENRAYFAKDSIFCLRAPFEVIAERLSRNSKRPLAANAHQLWLDRQPVYDKIFHQIASHGQPAEIIADRIAHLFKLDDSFPKPPEDFYPIHIASGSLARFSEFIDWLGLSESRIAVISNPRIAKLYPLVEDPILIPEGEQFKTLDTVREVYTQLLDRNFTRHDTIVALGGGVVGDIAGFVAATYFRGMDFVQVPTTLLAMVDSSVGGKTGVDLPEGKNLVGAFKNPRGVLIDPDLLKTLPERELRCGMAEIVKHAIIGDPELFEMLEKDTQPRFDSLIRRPIEVKIKIVREDPYEQSKRMWLNLGHTFGHAIELLSNFQIPHGEAVSIGLIQAAEYALQNEKCEPALVTRIRSLLSRIGLPTELPDNISKQAMWEAMRHDKKRQGNTLKLVLPRALGDVRVISVPNNAQ